MALHLRKQLRAAAVTRLTGLTTTGSRVRDTLVYPLQEAEVPALRVGMGDESIETGSMGGANRTISRTLELVVEGCVKQNATYEDVADAIQKEVEIALAGDNSLGGLCKYIVPRRVETEHAEGDKPVAIRRMIFEVFYITALNAPDVPL